MLAQNKIHKEILIKEQIELMPLLKIFSKNFGLVGGTAIAFYIGHRESIDFDLFSLRNFNNLSLGKKINKFFKIDEVLVNKLGEYTIFINGVKITFFHYPYKIVFSKKIDNIIKVPDLLTLAAMKAFALGMRAKWKDYVDIYFIVNNYLTIQDIIKEGKKIFGNEFNEKLFRSRLAYFKDIDYKERIIYASGFEIPDATIKKELIKFSLS